MGNKNRRMAKAKRREPWEEAAAEGLADVKAAADAAAQALAVKTELLRGCLTEATRMLHEAGTEGARLRLAEGGAMFVASDIGDYLSDGEPFTAFVADGADGRGYEAVMRIYRDEDDEEEGSTSADVLIARYDEDGHAQALGEDGWADVEEDDGGDDEEDFL